MSFSSLSGYSLPLTPSGDSSMVTPPPWHFSGDVLMFEYLDDPGRCQFREFLILLGCAVDGRPMARSPYAWVDRAVPLVRGWIQGMPKQWGSVQLTRAVPVGRAGPRPDAPGRYAATLAVHD